MSDQINLTMSAAEKAALQRDVDFFNKTINEGRKVKQDLGKDDFLKILITQLTHQDPTKPMEDKEFIAQMAQFSTLEQITNMNQEITGLASQFSNNQAYALLGKNVDIVDGERYIFGQVDRVIGGDVPQVMVKGTYYNYEDITSVSLGDQERISRNVAAAYEEASREMSPAVAETKEKAPVREPAAGQKEESSSTPPGIPPEELNGNISMESDKGGSRS